MSLDFLHDQRKLLKGCALVCRAWRSRSQHHLFYSLSIQIVATRDISMSTRGLTFIMFKDFLHSSSLHIGRHVHQLKAEYDSRMPPPESIDEVLFDPSILPLLPALERLTLVGMKMPSLPPNNKICPVIPHATDLQELSFQEQTFANVAHFIYTLNLFHSVDDLLVQSISRNMFQDTEFVPSESVVPKIRRLRVDCGRCITTRTLLDVWVQSGMANNLTSLAINVHGGDSADLIRENVEILSTFLSACGENLTCLKLYATTQSYKGLHSLSSISSCLIYTPF